MIHMRGRLGRVAVARQYQVMHLDAIPALRGLPAATIEAVAGQTRWVRHNAGAVLRHPGGPAHSVVFLLAGTVVATNHGADGTDVWPERWTGPAIVDKAAVLSGRVPATGLAAMTEVAAGLLPRAAFLRLLDEESSVRTHVLSRLAEDALLARHRLVSASRPAVARVAELLAAERWTGTQDQLGRLLGLSRVTVNRALSRLTAAGAIRRTTTGFEVADPAELALWTAR
jgi:CRP/FNR family transcriptional regulator, cyclic AMP receptor protein